MQERQATLVKVGDTTLLSCSFCHVIVMAETLDGRMPDQCPGCRSKLDGTPRTADEAG